PMTMGSRAVPPNPALRDGPFAPLLRATGLNPIGTTAMPPFGWTAATERQGGLVTRNPWDTDRTSGGSSGGSASLGAAGALPTAPLLRAAGLNPIGTTAMPPFGWTAATERQGGLVTRNPWDTDRTSGGSSGGSASLVAAGALPIAHANDGGGSIRIPAAVTGLV